MRRALFVVGVIVLIVAAIAALNGIVDPKDEFYSGDALSAALASNCLLADDVVHARSYPELKHDLFTRKHPTRIVLASDGVAPHGLDLGFPGFGPDELLDTMGFLVNGVPDSRRLRIVVVTQPSWFDAHAPRGSPDESDLAKLGYLVSPWTLASTLDLMRRSRTLAFAGWRKEPAGRSCIVDRGSPRPAFRMDGTFTAPEPAHAASRVFAWNRLSAVDDALGLASRRGWIVAGVSPVPGSAVYRRELKALFAKHGYRWRIRRMA